MATDTTTLDLLLPGDAAYDEARQIWNGTVDRRPAAIVRCHGTADVVAALAYGREHRLPVAVRGGGHNVAGTALLDGGLVIDVSAMRAVIVDPDARTAWVQAGARWGDVDRETQLHGLAVPGGVVSTTGVAGLTLSGGYSSQRRAHGMTVDNLLAAEVVTADGRVVRATADQHADLFWALRGGGGTFGAVTAFEYRLHELGPTVLKLNVMYALEDAERVLRGWRELVADAPDELTVDCGIWTIPDVPELPAELRGRPTTIVAGMWAGDPEDGHAAMEPFRALAQPLLDLTGPAEYLAVQQELDAAFPDGGRYFWKSLYLDAVDDELIDVMAERARTRPSPATLLLIRHLGGAIGRVGAEETAFGDRSSQFLFSADACWADPADDAVNIAWTRALHDAALPHSNGRTYFNFASDQEGEGRALVETTYGATYDRLVQVKAAYDPDGVFRAGQRFDRS